jgi:hypothetical protein
MCRGLQSRLIQKVLDAISDDCIRECSQRSPSYSARVEVFRHRFSYEPRLGLTGRAILQIRNRNFFPKIKMLLTTTSSSASVIASSHAFLSKRETGKAIQGGEIAPATAYSSRAFNVFSSTIPATNRR